MYTKSYRLIKVLGILVVLFCIGLFLYTQWDLKRFNEQLSKTRPIETSPETATTRQEKTSHDIDQTIENSDYSAPLNETESHTLTDMPENTEPISTDEVIQDQDDTLNMFFDDLFADIDMDTFTDMESTDTTENYPFNVEIVKAGYDDYNAYLATEPDYAYQRLDDAFREQFGDSSDVDIVVETIKRSNNGTMTFDDAINNAEALLRLISPISPPSGIREVESFIEYLRTAKQLKLEGDTAPISVPSYHIESD